MAMTLLQVENLSTVLGTEGAAMTVVDDVSWELHAGEVLGIVGESGSGKSLSVLSLIGLLPSAARIANGRVLYDGRDLVGLRESELRTIRGGEIAMIFQDPMTSFNPVRTIGSQIAEAMTVHDRQLSRRQAWSRAADLLTLVGVPNAPMRCRQYPNEFSGGMRQRAMLAMAMANEPRILIADEPTTALDVTTQAQVLDLLMAMQERSATAIVFISHDLEVVAEICDRLLVMYAGRIVESGATRDVLRDPAHPYTRALLSARPKLDGKRGARLQAIGGQPPNLAQLGAGCAFQPRCSRGRDEEVCRSERPTLRQLGDAREAACHFSSERGVPLPTPSAGSDGGDRRARDGARRRPGL